MTSKDLLLREDLKRGISYLESGDIENAVPHLDKASAEGNPLALYKLSVCYVDGGGRIAKNLSEAFSNCKKAAEADVEIWPEYKDTIAFAQYQMSSYFSLGVGGAAKDEKEAFLWTLRAANNGHMEAMGEVGHCLYNGIGIEKNMEQGFTYMVTAADGGDMVACANVFKICAEIAIADKNNMFTLNEAIKWGNKLPKNPDIVRMLELLNAIKQERS